MNVTTKTILEFKEVEEAYKKDLNSIDAGDYLFSINDFLEILNAILLISESVFIKVFLRRS